MIDKSMLDQFRFRRLNYNKKNMDLLAHITLRARYESYYASKDMRVYLDDLNIKMVNYPESSQGYPHPDRLLLMMRNHIIKDTIENPDRRVDPVFEAIPEIHWKNGDVEIYVLEAPNDSTGNYGPIAFSTWTTINKGTKPLNVASQIFVYQLFRGFKLATRMLKSVIKKKGLKKVYSEGPNEIGKSIIKRVCKAMKCELEIGYFTFEETGKFIWIKDD